MAEQRESRVWGDQGTEPDPGEETYSGGERPIAEHDNWAMWSATTDIKTLFDWLDAVESDLTDHTSSSTGVHGIASDDAVAGQSDVDLGVESHRQNETHDQPQPNQDHGNEDHTSTFAVDGDAQPPEAHGNGFHTTDYSAEGHDHTETSESQLPDSALKEDYVTSRFTNEEAQDAVAAALAGGDKVTIAYDDAGGSITIDTSALDAEEVESRINSVLTAGDKVSLSYDDGNNELLVDTSALDAEEVEDQVSSLITGGSGISVTYDDANNTLTIDGYTDADAVSAADSEVDNAATSVSGLDDEVASNNTDISTLQSDKLDSADYNPESDTHNKYTDEEAQDAVAAALAGGDKVTIAYDDAGDSITIDTSALDAEEVESRINSVLTAGDKVSLSYDDANDELQIDTSALDAEEVEDQVSSLITGGSGISVSYDDANNTLTINGYTDADAVSAIDSEVDNAATSVSGLDDEVASNNSDISTLQSDKLDSADYNPESDTHSKYTDEEAQDAVAAALAGGDKVTIAYDDAGNSITIDTSALDAEEVEDQINSVLTAGSNISLNYDDSSDTLTISSTDTDTQRTNEEIEDVVAGLISAGSNVSVNYDDANDTLTISSNSNTAIDLLDVESPDDLPDPSAVSQPTIAYVDSEDDYVGVFKQ